MLHHSVHPRAPLLSGPGPSSGSPSSPALLAVAWIDAFNESSIDRLSTLYAAHAEFDQPSESPLMGRKALLSFLTKCFSMHRNTSDEDRSCLIANLLIDGEWAVVRWHDALGLTGCYMFHCEKGLIVRQYGFWDTRVSEMLYESDLP